MKILALIFVMLCAASVAADSLIVQDQSVVDDSYLSSGATSTNYGNSVYLRFRYNGIAAEYRSILRFAGCDTLLGATMAVDSVKIGLYLAGRTVLGGNTPTITWYRMLKPYFEGDGTVGDGHPPASTPSHWRDSTLATSDSGYASSNLGNSTTNAYDSVDNRGDHLRPDRWATAAWTATMVGAASEWKYYTITDLFNNWRSGTYQMNGLIGIMTGHPYYDNNELADTASFYSSDYTTNTTLRPKLMIYFHDTASVAYLTGQRYNAGTTGDRYRDRRQ